MAVALVVDDHEMPRAALIGILLGRMGFTEVVEAVSLHGAYEALDARPDIALALFDLDMPGMDEGVSTLQDVRLLYPELRVAIVSGSARREDIVDALAVGLHGFIPKSSRLEEIETALRWILGGQIYVPASLAVVPRPPMRGMTAPVELTERQREVLHLLRLGRSNKEIARTLDIGMGTMKVHVSALLRILDVSGRTEAAVAAADRDLK